MPFRPWPVAYHRPATARDRGRSTGGRRRDGPQARPTAVDALRGDGRHQRRRAVKICPRPSGCCPWRSRRAPSSSQRASSARRDDVDVGPNSTPTAHRPASNDRHFARGPARSAARVEAAQGGRPRARRDDRRARAVAAADRRDGGHAGGRDDDLGCLFVSATSAPYRTGVRQQGRGQGDVVQPAHSSARTARRGRRGRPRVAPQQRRSVEPFALEPIAPCAPTCACSGATSSGPRATWTLPPPK